MRVTSSSSGETPARLPNNSIAPPVRGSGSRSRSRGRGSSRGSGSSRGERGAAFFAAADGDDDEDDDQSTSELDSDNDEDKLDNPCCGEDGHTGPCTDGEVVRDCQYCESGYRVTCLRKEMKRLNKTDARVILSSRWFDAVSKYCCPACQAKNPKRQFVSNNLDTIIALLPAVTNTRRQIQYCNPNPITRHFINILR